VPDTNAAIWRPSGGSVDIGGGSWGALYRPGGGGESSTGGYLSYREVIGPQALGAAVRVGVLHPRPQKTDAAPYAYTLSA
jgi:hypothetical protein